MEIKRGKIISIILVSILLVNFIYAIDTEIKIKTLPSHEVNLAIGESGSDGNSWNFLKKTSDEYGDALFIVSTTASEFDYIITIKNNGKVLSHPSITNPYKSLGAVAGEPIYVEIIPSWYVPKENPEVEYVEEIIEENLTQENITETKNTEEIIENETLLDAEKQDATISGNAVSENNSSNILYYGGGLILLIIIAFVFFVASRKLKVSVRKQNENQNRIIVNPQRINQKDNKKDKKVLIDDVKKKMKEIEEDMEELNSN